MARYSVMKMLPPPATRLMTPKTRRHRPPAYASSSGRMRSSKRARRSRKIRSRWGRAALRAPAWWCPESGLHEESLLLVNSVMAARHGNENVCGFGAGAGNPHSRPGFEPCFGALRFAAMRNHVILDPVVDIAGKHPVFHQVLLASIGPEAHDAPSPALRHAGNLE